MQRPPCGAVVFSAPNCANRYVSAATGAHGSANTMANKGHKCSFANPFRSMGTSARSGMHRRRRRSLREYPIGANEMAGIAIRVALEIILMLGLRLPERSGRRHLGHDFAWPQA